MRATCSSGGVTWEQLSSRIYLSWDAQMVWADVPHIQSGREKGNLITQSWDAPASSLMSHCPLNCLLMLFKGLVVGCSLRSTVLFPEHVTSKEVIVALRPRWVPLWNCLYQYASFILPSASQDWHKTSRFLFRFQSPVWELEAAVAEQSSSYQLAPCCLCHFMPKSWHVVSWVEEIQLLALDSAIVLTHHRGLD